MLVRVISNNKQIGLYQSRKFCEPWDRDSSTRTSIAIHTEK